MELFEKVVNSLILIWVGFLVFFWGDGGSEEGEGGKFTPCLKLVRIMLETWNLVYKYTHTFSLRK